MSPQAEEILGARSSHDSERLAADFAGQSSPEVKTVGMISISIPSFEDLDAPANADPLESLFSVGEEHSPASITSPNEYWTFDTDGEPPAVALEPIRLPETDPEASAITDEGEETDIETEATGTSEVTGASDNWEPVAQLLPPQDLEIESSDAETESAPINPEVAARNSMNPAIPSQISGVATPSGLESLESQEQQLLEAVLRDYSATTGALTDARVAEKAKAKIGLAYAMANRNAHYAARQRLVEVLRMISQAKDAYQNSAECSQALAAGLRALEEANDFSPRGTQLEAEINIQVLCASHRTPIARNPTSPKLLPHQLTDRYYRYAQLKLAASVAGEPSGSMALHALGKLENELGKVEPHRQSLRRAIAFQQAALLSHDQNHLAAHELALLLIDSGHLAEAYRLLRQVAALEPNAIVLRNLALVEDKLGLSRAAAASRDYASQLSRQSAGGMKNVVWISPESFVRTGGAAPRQTMERNQPRGSFPARPGQRPISNRQWR